mgnify:CR=1 FL=1
MYLDLLRDLKRINSHVVSIAYPLLEQAWGIEEQSTSAEGERCTADRSPAIR